MLDVPDQMWDDVVTLCGLTRKQIFRLPVKDKVPGLLSSVEVALTVSRESLGKALSWLSTHEIRPLGRRFEGPYPGLLWSEAEIESHVGYAAIGCAICASVRQHVELKAS
jgi:hypothetical protein